jgi:hypothetical protein
LFNKNDLIQLGYSEYLINQYGTFIFDISWSIWSSQKPKKYPIINVLGSFNDLSINQITDLRTRITTVTIQWSSFTDYLSNDGLSFNPHDFPFYNEPSLNIRQFGGIPLTRNLSNNSNFWQFYKFGGSITANDSPNFLRNTNLTNCFRESLCKVFNIQNWNTYQVINMNYMFMDAIHFKTKIGNWNYSNIKDGNVISILLNTGYDSLNSAIFLESIAENNSINYYNIVPFNIGKIQNYLDTPNINNAIKILKKRNIIFEISGNPIQYDVTEFKRIGYTTSELYIEKFPILKLIGSGYSLNELRSGGYSIDDLKSLNQFNLIDYINAGFSLQEFINLGYKAIDLSINNYNITDYYNLKPKYIETDLKEIFDLVSIINAGYDIYDIKKIDFTLEELSQTNFFKRYSMLDYKKFGYSMNDLISADFLIESLETYSPLPQILKENNFTASDFKIVNYDIYKLLIILNYDLKDLYEANYNVYDIQNDLYLHKITDISFSIFDYKKAGFSMLNIYYGGFSINNLEYYSPLPQILKDNSFNAIDFKEFGYSVDYIYNTLKYTCKDLNDADFSLNEIKHLGFSVNDLKNGGYKSSELILNEYTLTDLIYIYSISELIDASFSLSVLLINVQNPIYFANYLNENKSNSLIIFDFIKILNYGYSIRYLSLNPVINSYYNFLFQEIFKIYKEPEIFNSYFDFSFNAQNAFNDLLDIWNNDAYMVRNININSFLIYNYYDDLGIELNNIQKLDFTKNEIIMLNYYKYYNQTSLFNLNDFYNSFFNANKLLRKNLYIVDYNNIDEINDLFINKDYIFYNNNSPFIYYNEFNID